MWEHVYEWAVGIVVTVAVLAVICVLGVAGFFGEDGWDDDVGKGE